MFLILMLPPTSTLFPYTTLFRSYLMVRLRHHAPFWRTIGWRPLPPHALSGGFRYATCIAGGVGLALDRKSTRLNSSHLGISYAVFCLKKKRDTYRNLNTIIDNDE